MNAPVKALGWCNGNTPISSRWESRGVVIPPPNPFYWWTSVMSEMVSYYVQHCENLTSIEKAIKTVQRTLREYIAKDEHMNIYAYTKLLSHLVNTWAEVRVLKLVYEVGAFSDAEKASVIGSKGPKGKWKKALDIAFCKAYGMSSIGQIERLTTPYTARTRYLALLAIIGGDLLESSELRNRIAHGQWKHAFNNDLSSLNTQLTGKLRQENIVKLQLRWKMFKSLAQIIHDLAVSKPTFERDFDNNFRRLEEQKRNFHNRDYNDYRERMKLKRQRGRLYRAAV